MKRSIIFIIAAACSLLSTNAHAGATNASETKSMTDLQANNQQTEHTYDSLLFPAVKDGKYGFIDIRGNFVIPPRFTSARLFREGLAAVMVGGQRSTENGKLFGGRWGYIDRAGKMMIAPQFGEAGDFSEGLALASVEEDPPSLEEWLAVARPDNPDYSDKELTEFWRETYEKEKTYGYIDKQGLFKILPKYSGFSSAFKNGVASVRLPLKMPQTSLDPLREAAKLSQQSLGEHWIDASGQEITSVEGLMRLGVNRYVFKEDKAINVQGKVSPVSVSMYGLKEVGGTIVVEAKFSYIEDFHSFLYAPWRRRDLTTACLPERWEIIAEFATVAAQTCGLIDSDGKFVAPPDFSHIIPISDDFAIFTIGCQTSPCKPGEKRKAGLYNTKERKVVINPIFDDMRGFSDGLGAVQIDGQWGFIDTSGQYVIPPKFASVGGFVNGLALVNTTDYIDRRGKYVYRGSIGTLKPLPPPAQRPKGKNEVPATVSGTGFVVSRQGHVLTNHHVIAGCRTMHATMEGRTRELTVVGSDAKNDLALLRLPAPNSAVAHFKEGRNIRSGDGVVVVGFPLHGLLASEANVTTGTVSALAGIENDTRFLQVTAPVQPGNSGGPLLDQSGNIVGVVGSKLDTMRIAKATGDVPQNINFAINGTVAKAFLDASGVQYETSTHAQNIATAEIAASAKKFTVLVECYR